MTARSMRLCALIVGLTLTASPLRAATLGADWLYTYTGDTFQFATGDYVSGVSNISGHLDLSGAFDPIAAVGGPAVSTLLIDVSAFVQAYSFTDGLQTLTQDNSTAAFRFGFNADSTPYLPGNVQPDRFLSWWSFSIIGADGHIGSTYASDYSIAAQFGDSSALICSQCGDAGGSRGSWTIQEVPEPASWLLLTLGIGAFAWHRHGVAHAEATPVLIRGDELP